MKKLLLLSLLILFSCSKEDSGLDSSNQALITSLNAQISALNAQISAMNSEISALQSQVAENSSLESQINDVISQLNEAQDALEESNSLLSQKTLDLEDAQNTIIGLVDIIDSLDREFALIELSIVLWIQRAAGFYEFEYYENNVYVGTFSWEIGLTDNNDIIWNSYYLSGNCYVKNTNASFGDDVQFYFTAVSFDDLGIGAFNVDGEAVGLPDYDKVVLVESYTIDTSGGLEVLLSAYDMNQNLIRTIVNDGSSLEKKTKSQLVYSFCSNNGISGSTNNQDSSDDTENQETSDNGGGSSTDNSNSSTETDNSNETTETDQSSGNGSDSTPVVELGNIYLDANGLTIKATADAQVGDQEAINGNIYTVVDETQLRDMIKNEENITYVVTSKITSMYQLFLKINSSSQLTDEYYEGPYNIIGDISSWDVSNVTNMENMFWKSYYINQDISSWDVGSVTNMRQMFRDSTFDGDISNWDVSNVTGMSGMFEGAPFNQDISNWDVSNVTGMSAMFFKNLYFNQDIGNWDVSNVRLMSSMFRRAFSFSQDLTNWDVSNVTGMGWMFMDASNFNSAIDTWDVSNVTNMSYMFKDTSYELNLSSWNVNNVNDCSGFSEGNTVWVSSNKPGFTNCNPN
jgi:surface protein